jgi:N-acetylmuramoyl-L-alanine amidase
MLRVEGTNPVKISLLTPQPFKYHSFRLHEPERYVIDFDSGSPSSSFNVPIIKSGAAIKDIRLGCPQDAPDKLRMVLDLVSTSTDVEETSGPNRLLLSVQGPSALDTTTGSAEFLQTTRNSDEYTQRIRSLNTLKRTNILKGMGIVLDAGHGGSDPGAQRGTIQEKDITLGIVEKLYRMLVADGARVSLTRSDDTFISIQDRVRLSLDAHPDIFLSVHINALETNDAIRGIETYYRTEQSLPLAQCIHTALVSQLDTPDRGIRNARFYVINHTSIPSVLAEVGFISNPEERMDLASGQYQNKVARALEDGVALYAQRSSQPTNSPGQTLATGATSPDEAAHNYSYSDSGRISQSAEQASVGNVDAPTSGRIHSVIGSPVLIPHI